MAFKWLRVCQSCGHKGFYNYINLNDPKERWRNTKCRKCKSEDLDYGHEVLIGPDGKIIENDYGCEE